MGRFVFKAVARVAKRLPPEKIQEIEAALVPGKSCHKIAAECGVSPQSVSRIAKRVGHDWEHSYTKKAVALHQTYTRVRRTELLDAGLAKSYELLKDVDTTQKMQSWWMGVAVGVDKRRQEDDSDGKRRGTIRQYLELEFNRPDSDESEAEGKHQAGE